MGSAPPPLRADCAYRNAPAGESEAVTGRSSSCRMSRLCDPELWLGCDSAKWG
jgi:hypothetical protein